MKNVAIVAVSTETLKNWKECVRMETAYLATLKSKSI